MTDDLGATGKVPVKITFTVDEWLSVAAALLVIPDEECLSLAQRITNRAIEKASEWEAKNG